VTEIETLLLQADVGVEATDYINALQNQLKLEALPPDSDRLPQTNPPRYARLTPTTNLHFELCSRKDTLNIWLITGVNGAGKTTTIGKIAHIAQIWLQMLNGAADTFRAAAVEQVKFGVLEVD